MSKPVSMGVLRCECGRMLNDMYDTPGGDLMVECPEHGLHKWREIDEEDNYQIVSSNSGTYHLVTDTHLLDGDEVVRTNCGKILEDFTHKRYISVRKVWEDMASYNRVSKDPLHMNVWPKDADDVEIAFINRTVRTKRCFSCCRNAGPVRERYAKRKNVEFYIPGVDLEELENYRGESVDLAIGGGAQDE